MKSLLSAQSTGSNPYNYPISKKPDPYAYSLTKKISQPPAMQKPKEKGPLTDFTIQNLGYNYKPPTILIEYRNSENGKLYHHKIVIRKLTKDTLTSDVIHFLKKKHNQYMKRMDQQQVGSLVEKLKVKLGCTRTSGSKLDDDQIEEPEGDFDYLEDSEEEEDNM